ncbi:MAG TPA: hypothetical protein VEB86_03100 [Chryseosolibacter sp.]|nr:hypothetical protein [Chryseosolibacter sp.]
MMRCIFLSLALATSAIAQDGVRSQRIPVHAIKFSPFHLIGFYPTALLGYEHGVAPNMSVQADVGYVFPYENFDEEFRNKRGVKLKLDARFYIEETKASYVAPEVYLNAVNFDRQDSRQECYDLECQILYRRTYYYKVRYREHGVGVKYGFVRYFGNFLVDLNLGFAIRFVEYKKPALTRQFNEQEMEWFAIPNERRRTGLMPLMGFRLGYRLQ